MSEKTYTRTCVAVRKEVAAATEQYAAKEQLSQVGGPPRALVHDLRDRGLLAVKTVAA